MLCVIQDSKVGELIRILTVVISINLTRNNKMTPNKYQELASRTLVEKPAHVLENREIMLACNSLGLCGEAGELAEMFKKGIFHHHGIDVEEVKKELGDCLWYISAIATEFDLKFEEIMKTNIDKLIKRYPNGFSAEDSKNREEYKR
jgi:NTP pyrophosphatase (non-canonical NTP hydrolase)